MITISDISEESQLQCQKYSLSNFPLIVNNASTKN